MIQIPKGAGQSNSITVIQEGSGYGVSGLGSAESQGSADGSIHIPKSEQKFRSQTQGAMINRNKNKLQPSTGSDLAVGNDPIRNTQRSQGGNTLKSKAVRQLLEQTLY